MYSNYLQLLEVTLAKYENAQSLCCVSENDNFRPVYAHANGIGCAIGCHLSAQQAEQLDAIGALEGSYGWADLSRRDDVRALVGDIFDNIFIDDLAALQSMHDLSAGVYDYGPESAADFRQELRDKIAMLKRDLWP